MLSEPFFHNLSLMNRDGIFILNYTSAIREDGEKEKEKKSGHLVFSGNQLTYIFEQKMLLNQDMTE